MPKIDKMAVKKTEKDSDMKIEKTEKFKVLKCDHKKQNSNYPKTPKPQNPIV